MKENIVKSIISDFHNTPLPVYRSRQLKTPIDTKMIISIVGPRRAGKTAHCINLIRDYVAKGNRIQTVLYINFEDERLDRKTEELDMILTQYQQMYPQIVLSDCLLVFDEIQVVERWELFVRRVYDTVCKNIIVTGSNSSALGKDIATSLRGRTLTYEILPLSFVEYLDFNDIAPSSKNTKDIATLQHYLSEYLVSGGFPELVFFESPLRRKALQDYFEVMMYKDLGERAKITDSGMIRYFLKRCFSSFTKSFSINKIYNELKSVGYKVGKNTVYEWVDICRNAYLFFTVPRYTSKIGTIEMGEKKLFALDNGLLGALGLVQPHEDGKLLEQAIFLECYRRYPEAVFFDANGYECDFLLGEWPTIHTAIQVTESLEDPDVKKRELKGLVSACKKFGLTNGVIITRFETGVIEASGVVVEVVPAWEWLVGE